MKTEAKNFKLQNFLKKYPREPYKMMCTKYQCNRKTRSMINYVPKLHKYWKTEKKGDKLFGQKWQI